MDGMDCSPGDPSALLTHLRLCDLGGSQRPMSAGDHRQCVWPTPAPSQAGRGHTVFFPTQPPPAYRERFSPRKEMASRGLSESEPRLQRGFSDPSDPPNLLLAAKGANCVPGGAARRVCVPQSLYDGQRVVQSERAGPARVEPASGIPDAFPLAAVPAHDERPPWRGSPGSEGHVSTSPGHDPEFPSPRSSLASSASSGSRPSSSPRTSLGSAAIPERPHSNRTSGISMGYDQRCGSPRSSLASQHSLMLSPRSSLTEARPGQGPLTAETEPVHGCPGVSWQSSSCSPSGHVAPPSVRPPEHFPESQSAEPPPLPAKMCCYPGGLRAPGVVIRAGGQSHSPRGAGRPPGQGAAGQKLEALSRQLEQEMEAREKTEYFGMCVKCNTGIYGSGQACQAMGSLYHTTCFTCCSCGRALRGKAFYNVHGKVYCEEDYLYSGFQQSAEKCFVCGHLIMEMILQALGKAYHPGCFRCSVCNDCLDGVPFTVDVSNNIYCVRDYHRAFAPKCAACGQPILPIKGSEETIRVVSMDKDYHIECYHCEDCGLRLNDKDGHRCYPLQGRLLCHACHVQRIEQKTRVQPSSTQHLRATEF
uniref:Wilms tumor protein 1-interacting protein-like n=1 Tax=Myxine glutinosa TaxID=7769 RepID=UPI00358E2FEE